MSIVCVAWVAILAGCSVPERGPSVPLDHTERALPLGISNVRFFADGNLTPIIQEGQRAHARKEAALQALGRLRQCCRLLTIWRSPGAAPTERSAPANTPAATYNVWHAGLALKLGWRF